MSRGLALVDDDTEAPTESRIGAYEVLFELGRGGMGSVVLARLSGEPAGVGGFERLVTIKRMHPHLAARANAAGRFVEEAKIAARIHHANVVGIHQVGADATGHFLVQDYVEGDTLDGLLDRARLRRQRLPPPIVLRVAVDALAGLHAAHETRDGEGRSLEVLHRDVSTYNLLVGRDGITRLLDFGIAKHALSSIVTDEHYMQGRLLYMAPEYLRREKIDRRFDVYGLGVTLWIALTGADPWPDASDEQIFTASLREGLPSLSSTGLNIAPAIERMVARATAREPEDRFSTARQMLDAIEELGRHTGWVASHAEVAELVEQLAGADLAARRRVIAERREPASRPIPVAPKREESIVVTSKPELLPVAAASNDEPVALPLRPRRGLAAVSFTVLAVAALAAFVVSRRTVPPSSGPTARDAAPTASTAAGPTPMASATVTSEAPTARAPNTPVEPTRARPQPGSKSSAPPTTSSPDPAPAKTIAADAPPAPATSEPAPVAAPTAVASPAPPPPSPTGAPTTISTANPYR